LDHGILGPLNVKRYLYDFPYSTTLRAGFLHSFLQTTNPQAFYGKSILEQFLAKSAGVMAVGRGEKSLWGLVIHSGWNHLDIEQGIVICLKIVA
jgi:hypothetical protein